ncbi:hypothetical protein BJX68DRAFT_248401 [Aspergillus pseudodeflectus]|uniref:Uncharacterized protein n=1 Tax=Aspergillus pseudodeflectus TaxID=176178 RepID=A0ABR4JFY0_9EURO
MLLTNFGSSSLLLRRYPTSWLTIIILPLTADFIATYSDLQLKRHLVSLRHSKMHCIRPRRLVSSFFFIISLWFWLGIAYGSLTAQP